MENARMAIRREEENEDTSKYGIVLQVSGPGTFYIEDSRGKCPFPLLSSGDRCKYRKLASLPIDFTFSPSNFVFFFFILQWS